MGFLNELFDKDLRKNNAQADAKIRLCKERCNSWFPNQRSLREGCYSVCHSGKWNQLNSKNDYLCSGKFIDAQSVFLEYGYNPCGGSIEQLKEDLNIGEAQEESSNGILMVIGALVLIGLYFLFKK